MFRATTEQQFEAPESEHEPTEEEILQKYIGTLGALRVRVMSEKDEFENAFLYNIELPDIDIDETIHAVSKIFEHASMIGASNSSDFGSLSEFISVMVQDIETCCTDIRHIQQSAEEV